MKYIPFNGTLTSCVPFLSPKMLQTKMALTPAPACKMVTMILPTSVQSVCVWSARVPPCLMTQSPPPTCLYLNSC